MDNKHKDSTETPKSTNAVNEKQGLDIEVSVVKMEPETEVASENDKTISEVKDKSLEQNGMHFFVRFIKSTILYTSIYVHIFNFYSR